MGIGSQEEHLSGREYRPIGLQPGRIHAASAHRLNCAMRKYWGLCLLRKGLLAASGLLTGGGADVQFKEALRRCYCVTNCQLAKWTSCEFLEIATIYMRTATPRDKPRNHAWCWLSFTLTNLGT
jgi:hypothetical protein